MNSREEKIAQVIRDWVHEYEIRDEWTGEKRPNELHLSRSHSGYKAPNFIEAVADVLAEEDTRFFDREAFLKACGVNNE